LERNDVAVRAAVLAVMALTALQAAAIGRATPPADGFGYAYKLLSGPTSSDERAFRTTLQGVAQTRSDGLFTALQKVLGGQAPRINFEPPGDPLTPNHLSAHVADGSINADPYAIANLVVDHAADHSGWTNQFPHEMAHTRQTPPILAAAADREGGAQAFADLVTAAAAKQARIPYVDGNYDGAYKDFVKQAQQHGNSWILGTQFGHPAVAFP
jgi:hypothetical protein